jgi:hypothetical protein
MVNSPEQAVARAKKMVANRERYPGKCLMAVRTDLNVPQKYGSAIEAWYHVPANLRHHGTPPGGFPVFYNLGEWGHVVLADFGGSHVFSNMSGNTFRPGVVQRVRRDYFGAELGWTTSINGVDLHNPPAVIPADMTFKGPYYPGTHGPVIAQYQRHLLMTPAQIKVDGVGNYAKNGTTVAAVIAYQKRHKYLVIGGKYGVINKLTHNSIMNLPLHHN